MGQSIDLKNHNFYLHIIDVPGVSTPRVSIALDTVGNHENSSKDVLFTLFTKENHEVIT
jgi:hypothetical protein